MRQKSPSIFNTCSLEASRRQFLLVHRTESLLLLVWLDHRHIGHLRGIGLSRFGASAAVSFLGSSSEKWAPVILPASDSTGAISEVLVGVSVCVVVSLQEQTPLELDRKTTEKK